MSRGTSGSSPVPPADRRTGPSEGRAPLRVGPKGLERAGGSPPHSPRVPRVLLTNDDGIASPGLAALVEAVRALGAEVVVVAPCRERSGIGHAVTLHDPVDVERVEFGAAPDVEAYAVKGTPADCVKVAVRALLADRRPVLCVSGVNRGPNVGVNVFYSGTVGAALEAAANGVPAVAVSKDFGERLSFADAARLASPVVREALARRPPPWHVLNVNVPDGPLAEIRGVRLTRHGVSGFDEGYVEEPAPAASGARGAGVRRFRLEGVMRIREGTGDTDAEALAEGYVSVTPLVLDLTARRAIAAREDLRVEWGWVEGPG